MIEISGTVLSGAFTRALPTIWTKIVVTYGVELTLAYWSSPSRFDKIIKPLLLQLALPFKVKVVTSAIVALASKARSEENFKVINSVLMEYMTSESAAVRLAAIETERELYAELGTEWAKMLPPTVPIISEVMEDEDDNVIDAAQLWIATIEKVTGISMQKLLT